jgi:CheY-like chemotaxis protein
LKKTLLLADDSPTIQKVINLTFADEGIDVIAVSDGNAAIQQLRELKPDLVMADVHMPGLNGYQICERIRQNAELSKVPVILLVGSFEPFDEEEAKRVGADDFLMKPFQSIRQLVSRVAALLEPVPADAEGAAPESGVNMAASLTPEDVFHDPWPEQPIAETLPETPTQEITEELSETPTQEITEELSETPTQEITEGDDLSDFDSEFDQKFPDAASLSSQYVDTAKFEPRDETAAGFAGTAAPENTPENAPEDAPEDTAETQPLPEEFLSDAAPAQAPERMLDVEEEEQPPVFSSEGSSILDLGSLAASVNVPEEDTMLEIGSGEPAAMNDPSPLSETAPAAGEMQEAAGLQTYNFREPDAFDDDGDIQESFYGLPGAGAEKERAVNFQAPAERVLDAEPSNISEDQADGFSAVGEVSSAPRQISPESIEAIAQRVFEKLSEKVVRELAREVVPEMKDLISKELARENNENE